jgi:integrase/recombinase XerD
MTPLRKRMVEQLQLRNLSKATEETYLKCVERYALFFDRSPERLGPEHVREYLLHLKNDRKVQTNTILVNRSGLRFCTSRR